MKCMAVDRHVVRRRILLCMRHWPSCGSRNVDDIKVGRDRSVLGPPLKQVPAPDPVKARRTERKEIENRRY